MGVALLGFLIGNWLNLSPDEPLAKLGAGLYAILLVMTLAYITLTCLRHHKTSQSRMKR